MPGDGAVPVTASDATIRRTYDRLSGVYDRVVARWEAPTRAAALNRLNPQSGDRILDVGCGTGHALVEIGHRVGADGVALGVDVSAGMLARATRRLHRSDPPATVGVVAGDARALPVQDGRMDGVYLAETLELFDDADIAIVLGELARVLDPAGRLCVVSMPRAGHERSAFVRGYEWLYRHVPGYAGVGCRPIYVERTIRRAGFEIERTVTMRRLGLWPIEIVTARPRRNKGH